MGHLDRVPKAPKGYFGSFERRWQPPQAGLPPCGARAVLCSTDPVARDPYPFYASLMPQNTLVGRVMYRSPIPVGTLFAPPMAWHAPQGVEHSDQIECTEATCGPRRLKGFVMAAQGHGEHPAAASRCRTLGKKFTTTKLERFCCSRC